VIKFISCELVSGVGDDAPTAAGAVRYAPGGRHYGARAHGPPPALPASLLPRTGKPRPAGLARLGAPFTTNYFESAAIQACPSPRTIIYRSALGPAIRTHKGMCTHKSGKFKLF